MFNKKEKKKKSKWKCTEQRVAHFFFMIVSTQCLNITLIGSSVTFTPEICTLCALVLVVLVN